MKVKRASIFTKLVVAALMVYAVVTLIGLQERIDAGEVQNAMLAQQIEETEISNAALEYSIQNSESSDTLEDIARSKLGLVYPGEKVFYDMGN